MERFRLWKHRVVSPQGDSPTSPDEDSAPGWEYLLLAHELHGQVLAYGERFARVGADARGPVVEDLGDAVTHVAAEIQSLGQSVSGFGALLNTETLEAAMGAPGVSGDARQIIELATTVADRYGELLLWRARLRRATVPTGAQALYAAVARYADRPIEEVETFAEQLLEQSELDVHVLRDGHRPSDPIVLKLTLSVDDEVQHAIERELHRLTAGAAHPRPAVAHTAVREGPSAPLARRGTASARSSPTGQQGTAPGALARGVALRAGGFAAIDFETATRSRSSACAVGVAIVRDGRVEDVETWLIRPPGNEYEPMNIHIHGITPEHTSDQPSFMEVWPVVLSRLSGLPIVAHNAPFDLGVIRACLSAAGARPAALRSLCSCALARRAWPGWPSYRLNAVAQACGVSFEHHRAGEDAAAAAQVGVAICGATGQPSILGAARALGVRVAESS